MGPLHHRGRPPAHPRGDLITSKGDALVYQYLTDLEADLRGLPANRRRELLDEVGQHVTAARAALDPETEAGIRTVLERLGDPADIAAEAHERFGVQAEPARPAIPWLELLALSMLVLVPFIILLGMSPLVPFLSWLAGLALLWRSHIWTGRDKRIGTLLATLAALGVGALNLVALASPLLLLGSLLFIALMLSSVIYLARRLRAHLAAMPATG
jgi:uncharacterized membrane protein